MATNPYVNKVVVNNQTLIDLTADTVDAEHLAEGYTAHDLSGAPIIGTMTGGIPVIESKLITANGTYRVPEGVDGFNPVVVNVSASPTITTYTVNNTLVYPSSKSTYSAWSTAVTNGGGKLEINLQQLGITSWAKFGAMLLTCVYWTGSGSQYMSALVYKDGNNLKLVQCMTGEQIDLSASPTLTTAFTYLSFPDMGGTGNTPIGTLSTSSASLQHFRLQSFYRTSNTSGKNYGDAVEIRQAKVFKIG